MDILVISDSHGHADRIESLLLKPAVKPDAVFFLGDGLSDMAWINHGKAPLYSVCGNCDMFFSGSAGEEIVCELDGIRIFATHGHRYSVKSTYDNIIKRAVELGADILLFGHTHTSLTQTVPRGEVINGVILDKPLYVMNPGSIGGHNATFGSIVIRKGQIILSIGEL